jgi:predicted ribosome quality control (RQC) complex YloA/Tae2 family protein
LYALIQELDSLLKNGRVMKIYQPDNTTITLQFRLARKTETLLIAADAIYPRLHTLQDQPQNPLNPPAFCMLLRKYLEPSRLMKIEQQGFDRIVHLHFEGMNAVGQSTELTLVFELMGRRSNLYLLSNDGVILDALKRFPDQGIMPGKPYLAPPNQGKMDPRSISPEAFFDELRLLPAPTPLWKWITDTFDGFSKVAAREVLLRAGFDRDRERRALEQSDWPLLHSAFRSLLDEVTAGGEPAFYRDEPQDFAAYRLQDRRKDAFASTNSLIQTVLGQGQQEKHLTEFKSRLRKQLANHRKRVIKKEAIQQTTLQEAEQADLYRHQGELLTASFHLIPQLATSVDVPDYTKEGAPLVTIALDRRLSPSANVQRIFKRYAKAKASQKHMSIHLKQTKLERQYLEDILLQIDLADREGILQEIEAELSKLGYLKRKVKPASKKVQASAGPDRYLSTDGLTILVGRNNQQNDHLTFRLSGPNHLWLHARNIAGSHVAILSEDQIPPSTLLEAAQLAAYFSQSRTSPKVPVDYTLRKHVRKPKGASPGFVHYEQAKTILVNPTDFQLPSKQN